MDKVCLICNCYGEELTPCMWIVAQSCPTLCNPMDCSLSGSTICGILQARILEWVASSFSRGSSDPWVEPKFPHCRQILYHLSQQGSPTPCRTHFFNFASCCFCSLKGHCPYLTACLGNPAPLPECLTKMLLFRTLSTCGWLQEGRNEHRPFQRPGILRDICKTKGLFYLLFFFNFLTSSLSLCFYKRIWHPDPEKVVIFETLFCHLLSLPAFQIKSYALPQKLVFQIYWPVVWLAEQGWTQ